MAKDKNENKFVQLQTKVSPEVYARLKAIEEKFGFSTFDALRKFADILIRFGDDQHNLSDDLTRVIRMFENIPGWSKSICLADGLTEMEIVEAFYVLRARRDPYGHRFVHVVRPILDGDADGWTCSYNVQRMIERFMEITNPSLYKHLRQLAVEMGTESMFDLLHRLADLYRENPDEKELRVQFEENDYERGNRMYQDTIYKRRHAKTMESFEGQQRMFEDE